MNRKKKKPTEREKKKKKPVEKGEKAVQLFFEIQKLLAAQYDFGIRLRS